MHTKDITTTYQMENLGKSIPKSLLQMDGVLFAARVGIFGQQAIPAVISMFFFWSVLITQIWGLVNQSQLDDRALAAAERVMQNSASSLNISSADTLFCTHCGARMDEGARFCSRCGEGLINNNIIENNSNNIKIWMLKNTPIMLL